MSARPPKAAVNAEEWQEWRSAPCTQWVMAALAAQMAAQSEGWMAALDTGWPAQELAALRLELAVRRDTLGSVVAATYGGLCGALGQEERADG